MQNAFHSREPPMQGGVSPCSERRGSRRPHPSERAQWLQSRARLRGVFKAQLGQLRGQGSSRGGQSPCSAAQRPRSAALQMRALPHVLLGDKQCEVPTETAREEGPAAVESVALQVALP